MRPASVHPWRLVRGLDVQVRFGAPIPGVFGWWDPDSRTIWIDPRLSQATRRSTVMHELLHAERGDESCTSLSDWHNEKQEAAVEAEASRRLITLADLADAVVWTDHLGEAADELWVDVQTLRARIDNLGSDERQYLTQRRAAKDGGES